MTNVVEKNNPLTQLLLWDLDSEPWEWDGHIALWKNFTQTDGKNISSIPSIVEEKSEEFRELYLSCIYGIGQTLVDGRRVVDHLELRNDFSYWWMTLPTLGAFGSEAPPFIYLKMLSNKQSQFLQ